MGNPDYEIKDISLAPSGRTKIEWVKPVVEEESSEENTAEE